MDQCSIYRNYIIIFLILHQRFYTILKNLNNFRATARLLPCTPIKKQVTFENAISTFFYFSLIVQNRVKLAVINR